MADSTIGELTQATEIGAGDLLVMEQNGQAKSITGGMLTQFVDRNVVNVVANIVNPTNPGGGTYDAQTGTLTLYLPRGAGVQSVSDEEEDGVHTITLTLENGDEQQFTVNDGNSITAVTFVRSEGYDDIYQVESNQGVIGYITVKQAWEDRGNVGNLILYSQSEPTAWENIIWLKDPDPGITVITTDDYNPSAKVNNMTQEVGVDANGRLWTNPNGTGEPGGLLTFEGVSVASNAWVLESTPTYEDYPYHADIFCAGVTSDCFADVVYSLEDAQGGVFAPVCWTYGSTISTGGVRIFASENPDEVLTIPTIATWR